MSRDQDRQGADRRTAPGAAAPGRTTAAVPRRTARRTGNGPTVAGMFRLPWLLALGCALMWPALSAAADDYPSRPIRLIVPQAPGGPSDIVARLVAQKVSEQVGQPIVVEDRPGAGSNIGTEIVAKSAPDGYTLVATVIQHVVNPFLFKSMPFDPIKDFVPITLLAKAPIVLVVTPDLPVKNVQELIALAKAKPGQLSAASAGNGGTSHLSVELFKARTGTDIVHIPYKGTQQALVDLIAGRAHLMFDGVITSKQHIESGKLRALMIAGPATPLLPGVPGAAEAGLPDFESIGIVGGILAPAGTPRAIVNRLNAEFQRAVALPEVRDKLLGMGLEPLANSPEQYAQFLQSETAKWGKLIREAKISAD